MERRVSSSVVGAWSAVGAGVVGVWISGVIGLETILWFAIAGILVSLGVVVRRAARGASLWIALVCLIAGYTGARVGTVDPDRIDVQAGVQLGSAAIVRMHGMVVERVEMREGRRAAWEPVMWSGVRGYGAVRVDEVWDGDRWIASSGTVRAVMNARDAAGIMPGDGVEVVGVLRGNHGASNLGDHDWRAMANMEGRAGTISTIGGGSVEVIGKGTGVWAWIIRQRSLIRERALSALGLEDGAGDPARVVLGALILGERAPDGRDIQRAFARVGVGHILAISGFHVALLVWVCVLLVRIAGIERGWVETAMVCIVLVAMWTLIPMRIPMLRAMVLMGALMLGRGIGRRYDPFVVLGWVALGLLVWRPLDVLGMGWQLSVGVTALLVWIGSSRALSGGSHPKGGVLGWAWSAWKINASCWVLAMPLVMWHVGVISIVGIVMAIVVAFLAGVLMVLGYGQVLVGIISPQAGARTLGVVEWCANAVAGIIAWVDGFGWSSIRGVNLGVWWTIGATLLIWMLLVRSRVFFRRGAVRRRPVLIACIALIGWGAMTYRAGSFVEGVRVDMIDVSDGSAYIIRSGSGSMLYDCGSLDFRVGGSVERAAWTMGVRTIPIAIVSHDNVDHFNGLVELSRAGIGFDRVYIGAEMNTHPSKAWTAARSELEDHGARIIVLHPGDRFPMGNATVRCLGGGVMSEGLSVNDTSLVVSIEIQTENLPLAILMTGDVGVGGIGALGDADLGGVAVMELPHHGSMNASVSTLVGRVDPKVVLQSTGEGRLDGRWDPLRINRRWFASGNRGGAWAQIRPDGSVIGAWAVDSSK